MRNIFDQYTHAENRITHTLMTVLHEDRRLLDAFLTDLLNLKSPTPAHDLEVLEQQYPGEEEPSEDEAERRGVPDGWISDAEGWCVLIESKVQAKLTAEQIRRHRRTAERRGFQTITTVAITARSEPALPGGTIQLEWRSVYSWLRRQAHASLWAARATEYFEVIEARLIDNKQLQEGALTMFSGFPFGSEHPLTYLEGKRLLGLALADLRQRQDLQQKLGVNPDVPGRPAITGQREHRVWDFLSLSPAATEEAFTSHPHLTLGITAESIEAMVTVPNAVNRAMRHRIKDLGIDGFRGLADKILTELQPLLAMHPGASPRFRGVQRRYPSQRAKPFLDAEIEFDLRTAVGGGDPKEQPVWLNAAYGAFVDRKGSNYQFQMGVIFPYDRCAALKEPTSLDMIAYTWLGCRPLTDLRSSPVFG